MEGSRTTGDTKPVDAFIERWRNADGVERSNFQSFADELPDLLAVTRSNPTESTGSTNDYVFERAFRYELVPALATASVDQIRSRFKGARKTSVEELLATLVAIGQAAQDPETGCYFIAKG